MPTDKEMLDWLDQQRTGYGEGVVFRMSVLGRGWRLHEIDDPEQMISNNVPRSTVRAAIADAMEGGDGGTVCK